MSLLFEGWSLDDSTLATLHADRDRLLRELDAYSLGERSIKPTDTDIATLRARLAILNGLIARQLRITR